MTTIKEQIIEAHSSYVNKVVFSPDGKSLFSIGFSGEVKEWDYRKNKLIRDFDGHTKSVNGIGFIDNDTFVTGSADAELRIWNRRNGRAMEVSLQHAKGITSLHVLRQNRVIALSDPDKMLVLRDLQTLDLIMEVKAVSKNLFILDVSEMEDNILIGGRGGVLYIHTLDEEKGMKEFKAHETAVAAALYFHNDENIISLGYHGDISLWDSKKLKEVDGKKLKGEGFYGLALSANEKLLAVSCAFSIYLLELPSLRLIATIDVASKGNYGLSFSPGGEYLALGSADKKIRIWHLRDVV